MIHESKFVFYYYLVYLTELHKLAQPYLIHLRLYSQRAAVEKF